MQEYDRQHGVTDLWSRVQEASRRYSTSTGDSELTSLEESLGANLTRMQRFEDRAALSYGESEQWSEQAAAVRADAQSIERELGQPFFSWLSERGGTDGRPIGAGGAMRIASPQTPEDAETLREHAAAFIAERFPAPVGPDPAFVAGRGEFGTARDGFEEAHGTAVETAHAGWAAGARDHATAVGAPGPGVAVDGAATGRGDVETELGSRESDREARAGAVREAAGKGRAAVAAENERPFREHATEGVPFVGEWLAGKLYGTARNSAPGRAGTAGGREPVGAPVRAGLGRAVRVTLVRVSAHQLLVLFGKPHVGVGTGAGAPVERVMVRAGRLEFTERRPVAAAEAPPEDMGDVGQDRPGERPEPDRREEVLPRPEGHPDPRRHARDGDPAEHEGAFTPRGRCARIICLCPYYVHGCGVYGRRSAMEPPMPAAGRKPHPEGVSPC